MMKTGLAVTVFLLVGLVVAPAGAVTDGDFENPTNWVAAQSWTAGTDPATTEFNVLSPLWFRRGAERFWDMYGPFWTLYRHEKHEDGGAADYALGRILSVGKFRQILS